MDNAFATSRPVGGVRRSLRTFLGALAVALAALTVAPTPAFAATDIAVTAVTADNKVYDGTTTATISAAVFDNALVNIGVFDVTLVVGSATFDTKDVGTGKTVTATTLSLAGADAASFNLTTVSINTTADITSRPITVTAATDTKGYDGTTSSLGVPTVTSGTVVGAETENFTQTFDTKDAGTGKTLTPAGNVNGESNYAITFVTDTTGVITLRPISVTATTDTKVYDGTTASSAVPTLTSGTLVGGEVANFTQTFDNRNVGTGKTLTATGNVNGESNYAITFLTDTTGVITARPLTVTAASDTKVYDGTTSSTGIPTVTGGSIVGGETGNFSQTFATRDVGFGKTLNATGNVNGETNYFITFVPDTTGAITPFTLTLTAVADDKTYDATTTAMISSLTGNLLGADVVTLTPTSGTFDDRNAGTDKTVTVNGIVIGGTHGGNYQLSADPVTALADIFPRALQFTAVTDTKSYDGTTSSTGTPFLSSGVLQGGDTVGSATQTFDTRNVGTGKTLTPTATISDGNGGANYSITGVPSTTGVITQRAITVTASSGNSRVYDATTASPGTPTVTGGSLATGDTSGFAEAYDDKNAGSGKTITPTGVANDGNGGANYLVSFVSTTDNAITPRTLTLGVTAADKPVDGTVDASVTITDDRIGGDDLTVLFASAEFDNPFVGAAKPVTVSGITLGGPDGGNYTPDPTTLATTASITAVLGVDPEQQVFDSVAALGTTLRSGPTSYLIAADINGDDRMDVINVTRVGAQVFRNDGVSGTALQLTLLQELNVSRSVGGGAIDIDRDGDIDLILGDIDHIVLARNDGTGTFLQENILRHDFQTSTIAMPFNSYANTLHPNNKLRIALVSSVDREVIDDRVGGPSDGFPHLYILEEDGSGGWDLLQTLDSFNVDGIHAHDLDDDGLNDLFSANRTGVRSAEPIFNYRAISETEYQRANAFDTSTFLYDFTFGPTDRVVGTNFGSFVEYPGFAVGSWDRVSVFNGTFGSWNAPVHVEADPLGTGGFLAGEIWSTAFADMNGDGSVDLVAGGRSAPLMLVRLDTNPNFGSSRDTAATLSGVTYDLLVRDWDFDANNAPDVVLGRSDGLWYYHNRNGATSGGGTAPPGPVAPTAGEDLDRAIRDLYAATDPEGPDPINSFDPTFPNGVSGTSYFDEAARLSGVALSELLGIDPRFTGEVPNFVFGADTSAQIETLRNYWNRIANANVALSQAFPLVDANDQATILAIQNNLLSAQQDIIRQGQALGGATGIFAPPVPAKPGKASRSLQRLQKQSLKRQEALTQSIAAARTTDNPKKRARLIRRANRQGDRVLRTLLQLHRKSRQRAN